MSLIFGSTCTLAGCGKATWAKGYCKTHYMRSWRYGDPSVDRRAQTAANDPRGFVERRRKIDANGCWNWTAAKDRLGYGRMAVLSKPCLAHRFAYEAFVGPIPDGLVIDHLCRNPGCVNPAHMEPVTLAENTRRGEHPAAICQRTDRCFRGHPFTPENTMAKPDGYRECRHCRRDRENARRRTAREAAP